METGGLICGVKVHTLLTGHVRDPRHILGFSSASPAHALTRTLIIPYTVMLVIKAPHLVTPAKTLRVRIKVSHKRNWDRSVQSPVIRIRADAQHQPVPSPPRIVVGMLLIALGIVIMPEGAARRRDGTGVVLTARTPTTACAAPPALLPAPATAPLPVSNPAAPPITVRAAPTSTCTTLNLQ